jgi:hypothetical protein
LNVYIAIDILTWVDKERATVSWIRDMDFGWNFQESNGDTCRLPFGIFPVHRKFQSRALKVVITTVVHQLRGGDDLILVNSVQFGPKNKEFRTDFTPRAIFGVELQLGRELQKTTSKFLLPSHLG